MKVLVTGASGFIGGYLVKELLKQGYNIRAISRKSDLKIKGVEVVLGDITKPETLIPAMSDVEAIFHNAAYAIDYGKKEDFFKFNVQGTRNIADACEKTGIKQIVYTGSCGIYGFPNKNIKIKEDSFKHPLNAYQKSKFEGERVLQTYKNLHVSIVRPPLVLGAGAIAVQLLLTRMKNQKLPYIGDGNQLITIVHPGDVAQCLRLALENDKKGDAYNVVSFICSIKQLYEKTAKKMGVPLPEKHISYPLAYFSAILSEFFIKEPAFTRYRVKTFGTTRPISGEKAQKILGFKPNYDFESTIEDMVSWYKKTNV
jgi:nucleoside-diphosphate-sugar epimerase